MTPKDNHQLEGGTATCLATITKLVMILSNSPQLCTWATFTITPLQMFVCARRTSIAWCTRTTFDLNWRRYGRLAHFRCVAAPSGVLVQCNYRIRLQEFHMNQFINADRKADLATKLNLTERQIKIWFQNR